MKHLGLATGYSPITSTSKKQTRSQLTGCRYRSRQMPTDPIMELRPALCPPRRRLEGVTRNDFVRMIKWHEREAQNAMNSLHCGSENWEYRAIGRLADAHWCAAALMRLHIGAEE